MQHGTNRYVRLVYDSVCILVNVSMHITVIRKPGFAETKVSALVPTLSVHQVSHERNLPSQNMFCPMGKMIKRKP